MADLVTNQTKVAWRQTEPRGLFRNYTLTLSQMNSWNFGGIDTYNDLSAQFTSQFKNRWDLSIQETYVFSELATRLLRGGPAFRLSPYWKNSIVFNTDKSRRVLFSIKNTSLVSTDGVSRQNMIEPALSFRLGNHIFIKSEFEYARNTDDFMYVAQKQTGTEWQYVLARIKQQTYNITLRLNYNITPDISLQYYGSPFISTGSYSNFKRVADAASSDLSSRTHTFTDSEIAYEGSSDTYIITEGPYTYSFGNPDFSFCEFRSDFVARWEYRPGSTIYLVWENSRNNRADVYYSSLSDNLDNLYSAAPTNVFMVKLSFWLGL